MKIKSKAICVILVLIVSLCVLVGCNYESVITLRDINLQYAPDGTIKQLSGDKTDELLDYNIDRGFRLETYYTLGSGRAWPTDKGSDGYKMLGEEREYYTDDKVKEIQVYIYLNEYYNKPLDDIALNQMKDYFERIKSLGMSMLLRFAYDYDQPSKDYPKISPTQEVMLGHIAQIKKFNQANEKLIKDTVTAYQFGMIGAWGEWGATNGKYKEKVILDALIDAFPEGTYFQGRYMRVVNQTDKNDRSDYVGYHNDFMVGRPHPWNTASDKYRSNDYKKFYERNRYRMNDGEMPWGGYTEEPDEKVNGINFLKQVREHSLNTLSIKHNYIEERIDKNGVMQNSHNINRWKTEYVTPELLKANKLPYYENWFKDSDGNTIKKSVYDYLRDYLGYLFVLDNLKIAKKGSNTEVSFVITNYGLGTPLTINNMELVVADKDGNDISEDTAKSYYVQQYNPKNLVSAGQQKITITIAGDITNKAIGLKLSRGDYSIRTANDIQFIGGVNYFKV